jgi:hypothetical protein
VRFPVFATSWLPGIARLTGGKQKTGRSEKPENAMFRHIKTAGTALILLGIGGTPALAQNRAQDLKVSVDQTTEIVLVKTTPQQVAFTTDQSGSQMPPVPETGNIAMLITGVCLAGVAASRRKVAA